jgi:hypothetical protein
VEATGRLPNTEGNDDRAAVCGQVRGGAGCSGDRCFNAIGCNLNALSITLIQTILIQTITTGVAPTTSKIQEARKQ